MISTLYVDIRECKSVDLPEVRLLYADYAREFNHSVCFNGFQKEIDGLPGNYAPPRGSLLVAAAKGGIGGTIALRPMSDNFAEMKRLFVIPEFRQSGYGNRLIEAAIDRSKKLGYQGIKLDTLPDMKSAQRLYQALGFESISDFSDCTCTSEPVEKLFFQMRFTKA